MRRKRKVIKVKDTRAELAIKGKTLEDIFEKITIRRKRAPRKPRREKEVLADLGIGKKQAGANFQTFIPDRQVPIYSPYRNNYYVPKPQDYNAISGVLADKSKDVKGEVEKQLNELLGKFQSGSLSLPYINPKGLPNPKSSSSSGEIADKVIGQLMLDEEEIKQAEAKGAGKVLEEVKKKRSDAGKKASETKKKNKEQKIEEERKKKAEEQEFPDFDITEVLRFRFLEDEIDAEIEAMYYKWYLKYQEEQLRDNGEYETNPATIETDFIREEILGKKDLVDKYLRYEDGGVIA
jgi:hypothetical protein